MRRVNLAGWIALLTCGLAWMGEANDLALIDANMGRETAVPNGAVILTPRLTVAPGRKTLLAGTAETLVAHGSTNPITWFVMENPSGATLSTLTSTSALYQAGTTSAVVDVIQAWDGDNQFGRTYLNVLSAADVTQVGKAVIMAGRKGPDDGLWPVTDYLADYGYNTLLYRGFSKENVHYLSCVTEQDSDGNGLEDDVDLATTHANAADTFTTWVNEASRLFVYLVDHGGDSSGEGYFRLNESETLTAAELDGWLDTLQSNWNTEVTVLLDFCHAGSFLDELTFASNRIVIAACTDTEPSYFMAGGLASFSDAFFCGVKLGLNIDESFRQARDAMSALQTAWLDDNGDGTYQDGVDGTYAATQVLGASCVAGKDIPQIGLVCGNQLLTAGTTATLWADDVTSEYEIEQVWCLVIPPSHTPEPDQPVSDIPEVALAYDQQDGWYEGRYEGFVEEGTYKVVYYARDVWGSVSLPVQRYVIQEGFEERVILVNGGLTNGPHWSTLDNMARQAYHTCLRRWLDGDSIYYISAAENQDVDGDGTNDVDALPVLTNLEFAVREWAGTTNWGGPADKLTVFLMGEESGDAFELNASETLSAAVLDSWLDEYQLSNQPPAMVILEFDGSGAFVPDLTPPADCERVILACVESGKNCVWAARGRMSFSGALLGCVFNGMNMGDAFDLAALCIRGASGRVQQLAQLDGDGDGVPNEPDQERAVASTFYLGSAFMTGDDSPAINTPMPETPLPEASTSLVVWAEDVTDMDGVSNVWCTVTDPEYDGSTELPETNLLWNASTGRYEVVYGDFTNLGAYVVTFFAEDTLGEISEPRQSWITRYQDEGDTDADEMLDGWEVQFFGGVTNADADTDEDGDTFSNWAEWLAGTDPTNPGSVFELGGPAAPAGGPGVILAWPSLSGRIYSVDFTTNLVTDPFAPLVTNLVATPAENVFTDDVHAAEGQLFYRIRVGRE
ncbi:MAG: hypothetical protein JXR37_30285 [Kiritimatiellae bacterium]|nr:hypothetical protein [Kiritimatiellia bacterium]